MAVTEDLTFRMNFVGNAVPQMQRVERQLKRVSAQTDRATRTLNRHAGQYNRTSVMTNKWAKGALQQAGYQVGDFAVQVANGTSKMQAFGQQGSQLLGIFGPIGAVLGAGVAIFSALSVAASKSGRELGDLAAVLGVFADPVEKAVSSIKELGGIFGGVFGVIVNNIDTAIIAIGLYAAILAGKYVFSTAVATASTVTFTGAMYSLGVAVGTVQKLLMRFLPFALLVGVAKLIELFLRLKKGAGGFGEALSILKDVAAEMFGRIAMRAEKMYLSLKSGVMGFQKAFIDALIPMAQRFDDFANMLASKWNQMFGAEIFEPLRLDLAFNVTDQLEAASSEIDASMSEMSGRIAEISEALGLPSEAMQRLRDAIAAGTEDVKLFGGAIEDLDDEGGAGGALTEMQKRIKSIADTIQSSLSDAFMSMVDGTKTAKEAFKDMARAIIKKLFEVLVVQRAVNALMRAIGFGTAPGTTGFTMFTPPSFDGGGYTGSGGRSGGIDGKGGFPAILHPNETVIDHTKGGGSSGVVVNQTINVSTGVQQTVRTEIKTLMPQIADAAKAAVADAKRRGEMGFA